MDSSDTPEEKRSQLYLLLRCCVGLSVSLLAFFSLSFVLLYVAVFVGNLSIWNPISLPSRCKIVSSSVDLRTSKICELGILNYKAKRVFNPLERKKFRCHYDYYWASVFKVEYIDHSGQARLALAEAPNEALPSDCRPNFGAAWMTKDKFKINETYGCSYTLGISKVNIHQEGLFDCHAEGPSTIEMLRRYLILFAKILTSSAAGVTSVRHWSWGVIAGLLSGCLSSMITIGGVGLLRRLNFNFRLLSRTGLLLLSLNPVRLRRACFLIAYVSFMSWLAVQYVKRVGLYEIGVQYSR